MIKESILRERLSGLTEILKATPRPDGGGGARGSYVPEAPVVTDQDIDELLDYLQLRAKYLVFDLEATRRENRYLRQMLERRSNLDEGPESL